ncbi:MAG TPA: hypothetical protein VM103_00705 [Candidatus Paceibacterota bacterium]|nr:hypothetical protein [Candidatus Paceibacterota bacterium]
MTWATQQRIIIISILLLVFGALAAVTLIATLHKTPSCTDGIQNQEEAGIDCGSPCAYLCTAQVQAPVTLFTRVLSPVPGRADVVALITNSNLYAAAKNVHYTVELYGSDHSLVKTVEGTMDLPPASGVEGGRFLVFIPSAAITTVPVTTANLTTDLSSVHWYTLTTDPRIVPDVGSYLLTNEAVAPRISAILSNPTARPLTGIKTFVAIYDAANNVLAASQTIVPSIPPQGSAQAPFTWNAPFAAPITRVDVVPVIPLP